MEILIKNEVTISGANSEEIRKLQKYLTIDNPLFNQRLDMGLANWGIPSSLKYYKMDGTNIIVPVGALQEILQTGVISATLNDIKDLRGTPSDASFFSKLKFTGKLRDYQEDIIKSCSDKSIGVIEALTSAGKTIVYIKLIVEKKVNTLILLNTIELVNQTRKSILKFTNLKNNDIGFVGSGEFVIKPITIGLHQTMAKLPDKGYKILNDTFGMIIADECHIVPSQSYFMNMSKLKAKYKWGCSGTPRRSDGLTPVIHYATGPTIHVVPTKELKDYIIVPTIEYINTNYYFPLLFTQEYQNMITDLSTNDDRNKLIADLLLKDYKNNYVILLCNRLEQVKRLQLLLGNNAATLTSKMKKKDRAQVMNDLIAKKKKYIISTYSLYSTGIDISHFDTLFLCSPIKSEIKLRQSAGRLMRTAPGKTTATIVDFVDTRVDLLVYHAKKRRNILEKLL